MATRDFLQGCGGTAAAASPSAVDGLGRTRTSFGGLPRGGGSVPPKHMSPLRVQRRQTGACLSHFVLACRQGAQLNGNKEWRLDNVGDFCCMAVVLRLFAEEFFKRKKRKGRMLCVSVVAVYSV